MTTPSFEQIDALAAEHRTWRKKNLQGWMEIVSEIFPNGIPKSAEWTALNDIVSVLSKIGSRAGSNHLFFPRGGGLDLSNAILSAEQDCIELDTNGIITVVKPVRLTFESIDSDPEGTYFRLETHGLRPSDVYEQDPEVEWIDEEVTRLRPNEYGPRWMGEEGNMGTDQDGKDIPLPTGSQIVTRLAKGAFVIFAKGSAYNGNTATYDARHNRVSKDEFKLSIREMVKQLNSHRKS